MDQECRKKLFCPEENAQVTNLFKGCLNKFVALSLFKRVISRVQFYPYKNGVPIETQ